MNAGIAVGALPAIARTFEVGRDCCVPFADDLGGIIERRRCRDAPPWLCDCLPLGEFTRQLQRESCHEKKVRK